MNDLTSLSREVERLERDNPSFADLAVELRSFQDQNAKLKKENHTLRSMEMQRREHHGEMSRRLEEVTAKLKEAEAERDAAENERDEYRAEYERIESRIGVDQVEEEEKLREQIRSGEAVVARLQRELDQARQHSTEVVGSDEMQNVQQVCSDWATFGKCRFGASSEFCSRGYHPAQAVTETMIPVEKTSHSMKEV